MLKHTPTFQNWLETKISLVLVLKDAVRIYQIAHSLPKLNVMGVDCHIGSAIDLT